MAARMPYARTPGFGLGSAGQAVGIAAKPTRPRSACPSAKRPQPLGRGAARTGEAVKSSIRSTASIATWGRVRMA